MLFEILLTPQPTETLILHRSVLTSSFDMTRKYQCRSWKVSLEHDQLQICLFVLPNRVVHHFHTCHSQLLGQKASPSWIWFDSVLKVHTHVSTPVDISLKHNYYALTENFYLKTFNSSQLGVSLALKRG